MNPPITLAIIYGSAHQDGYCDTIIDWITAEADRQSHFDLQLIVPVELNAGCGPLPAGSTLKPLEHRLDQADAFIVITPNYHYGHVAPLNNLIDAARKQWQAKPVGFISYGGLPGDQRATEQLRLMFARLQAITLNKSVNFTNAVRHPCTAKPGDEPVANLDAMKSLLAELGRWGTALRTTRHAMA